MWAHLFACIRLLVNFIWIILWGRDLKNIYVSPSFRKTRLCSIKTAKNIVTTGKTEKLQWKFQPLFNTTIFYLQVFLAVKRFVQTLVNYLMKNSLCCSGCYHNFKKITWKDSKPRCPMDPNPTGWQGSKTLTLVKLPICAVRKIERILGHSMARGKLRDRAIKFQL